MLYNFHVFVSICTFVYYIVLKNFQSSLHSNKPRRRKRDSKLIYILFLPIVLYLCYYFFVNVQCPKNDISQRLPTVKSSIDSAPYPPSSVSVSSI